MAHLKQWQEIARLGQRILHELELQNTNNVLPRWMAYRVSELIKRTEATIDPKEKEIAEKECQDLIIRLWESRNNWPTGGPLHSLMPTLKILLAKRPSYYRFSRSVEQSSEGGLITKLLQLQNDEIQQIFQLVKDELPSNVLESMQDLLKDHKVNLSDAESSLISFIIDPSQSIDFNDEEFDDGFDDDDDDGVPENSYVSQDENEAESVVLLEFRKSLELKREKFYKELSQVLKKGSPPTSD